jgi:hypothetical protein
MAWHKEYLTSDNGTHPKQKLEMLVRNCMVAWMKLRLKEWRGVNTDTKPQCRELPIAGIPELDKGIFLPSWMRHVVAL